MSSIEEEIFVEPDQLKTRMRLSEDDLKKVFAAFDEAGIEIKELEWYGVSVFDLSLGEVENIKNNNRILLVCCCIIYTLFNIKLKAVSFIKNLWVSSRNHCK